MNTSSNKLERGIIQMREKTERRERNCSNEGEEGGEREASKGGRRE